MTEVKGELQAILNSRAFRQSRGSAKLLKYLCSHALLDDPDQVTEYVIAVDVLGKSQDFKDARDASVRVEAHRLRKRLAQFYEEEGSSHRLRIVIPTGSYSPEFHLRDESAPGGAAADGPADASVAEGFAKAAEEVPDSAPASVPPETTGRRPEFAEARDAAAEPGEEERRALVRAHVERILATPAFRHSKKYAGVLRYIVEQTLEGAGGQLRERTIGAAVFGREPGYDTANDHVVRSAMVEVRRRLAQYYREEGAAQELRIDLYPGSYAAQFRFLPPPAPVLSGAAAVECGVAPRAGGALLAALQRNWMRMGIAAGMAVAITVVLLAIARVSGFAESALDTFWRPVLAGTGEVLLSVGNLESGRSMPPGTGAGMDLRVLPVMGFHTSPNQAVLLSDAAAASRFAGMLTARGRSYKIVSQPEAAFADLESGPAILIGLQHIAWTARITGGHRFSVDAAVPGKLFIRDRNDPSQTGWSQDLAAPHLQATKDYGLVCRIIDPKTKRMVVAVAGISPFGAQAAAELLTSPIEIRKLGSVLRQGRESKNIEAVIATDVIRGKPGHPTVIATHCW